MLPRLVGVIFFCGMLAHSWQIMAFAAIVLAVGFFLPESN